MMAKLMAKNDVNFFCYVPRYALGSVFLFDFYHSFLPPYF